MWELWQNIKVHKRVAFLFLVYWLATLVVNYITFDSGISFPVVLLLLTTPLIAGILVGFWQNPTSERIVHLGVRIGSGVLVGLFWSEITFFLMKGGAFNEVIHWINGSGFQGGEVLEFAIVVGIFGIILGLVGMVIGAFIPEIFRQHGSSTPPTRHGE